MKKIISALVAFVTLFCITSCSNNQDDDALEPEPQSIYYVKYVAHAYNIVGITSHTYEVASPDGYKTIESRAEISETYGPVKKGFTAAVKVKHGGQHNYCKIYVSKDNGPFALKAEGEYSAYYTIND